MVPDKFNMVDMEGVDIIENIGVEFPGLYQKLVESIAQCRYQCLYNWKSDGINIPPSYVELAVDPITENVLINTGIYVTPEGLIMGFSSLPHNFYYKQVTVQSDLIYGQSVLDYLVNNEIIPDCSIAFVSLHFDFNGDITLSDYYFVSMTILGLMNRTPAFASGVRFRNSFQSVSVNTTYSMRVTAGDVLDIFYITSEE